MGAKAPVFVGEQLFCWVANVLHHSDVGGSVVGSFCVDAADIFSDPPAFPPFKIVEAGRIRPDLEQVFINLATNARDAIEATGRGGGNIWVSTKTQGDFVEVIFRDDGCGMNERTKAKAFNPFFTHLTPVMQAVTDNPFPASYSDKVRQVRLHSRKNKLITDVLARALDGPAALRKYPTASSDRPRCMATTPSRCRAPA